MFRKDMEHDKENVCSTRRCVWLTLIIVMLLTILGFIQDLTLITNTQGIARVVSCTGGESVAEASYCDRIDAMVMILCGQIYAQTTLANRAVESVRGVVFANFPSIPLYILTSEPDCFKDDPVYDHPNIHIIHIQNDLSSDDKSYMIPMHYKANKMAVFDYLPERNAENKPLDRVLYVDADILITPLFTPWLERLPRIYKESETHTVIDRECTIGMMPERAYVKNEWQSGIMYMHRRISTPCLTRWKANVLSGKYHFDQDAYDDTPECQSRCPIGKVDDVIYSRDAQEVAIELFNGLLRSTEPQRRAPFIHFTGYAHRPQNPCEEEGRFSVTCLLYTINPKSFATGTIEQRSCFRPGHEGMKPPSVDTGTTTTASTTATT